MYVLEFSRNGNFKTMSRPCGRTLEDAEIAFDNQAEIFRKHNKLSIIKGEMQYYISSTVLRNKDTNEIIKEYKFY
jgi:hypothetical protein